MTREAKASQRKSVRDQQKRKKSHESDSSDSDVMSSDEDSVEDEGMNAHELRKYIHKIFPSKHMEKKVKAGEKLKETLKKKLQKAKKAKESDSESETEDDDEEDIWETASSSSEPESEKKAKKHVKKNHRKQEHENDDDEDESSEEEEEDTKKKPKKGGKQEKLNIVFTIGSGKRRANNWAEEEDDEDYDEDFDEDYDEDEDEYELEDEDTEDEDESVSSDDSSSSEEEEDEDDDESTPANKADEIKAAEEDKSEFLVQMKELLSKNPEDKSIQKCIQVYEEERMREYKAKVAEKKRSEKRVVKKEKKQKAKNMRIFRKIMKDKNSMNDYCFYGKLPMDHQKKLIKELREINKITRIEKPYRMTLLEADIPVQFKAAAMKKVNSLRYLEPGSGDFYKIKNWVDTFMKIPFTNYKSLPISIENGVDSCHDFMEHAQKILDEAVYGLNDAKMQIMQMLGQLLSNPKAIGTAIAIHGPPGTGKTSLVKEGISKILNRPFAFIALGGATDSSFLEGHGYTYEGSTWGKIVQILIDSQCMNPVIYFDELDKISETPRGEEIAGILTHLTDTSQNSQFHDKYFAEINFDLSKCLFIFSYNDESKVNPILRDRMYRIKTKGYSCKEKTAIANNYLLPRIKEQVKFNDGDITIPDDVLGYINEKHCNKEDGVRNLKRCLEIIYTKLNLYRLMRPGTNLFEGEIALKVEFPFQVTKQIVDKLIKKDSDVLETWRALYV